MGYLKKYRINFRALDQGTHHFRFDIEDRFFSFFEKSEIEEGQLQVEIELIKEERLTTLNIHIKGKVKVMCDRCLDNFMHPVDFNGTLYLKPEEDVWDEKDRADVVLVAPDESSVQLSQYFYESIHLALPLKRVHPEDEHGESTCDPEMLKLLEEHQQDDEEMDPRWNKLKNIFVKRN